MFAHNVYFYPRELAQPGDAQELLDGLAMLSQIPGLTLFATGLPAQTTDEVVDNSYLVALITTFTDRDAHDAYQVHPIHLAFIESSKHLWSRVTVFDSICG
jgi:Stress responsive A/B Barrel Domain